MDEGDLESWVSQNREQLTISFLGWVAEEEAAAPAGSEQERLWDLGSRLMAFREGLTPVSAEQLSKDLALAATQTNKVALKERAILAVADASSSPALAETVLRNAALGLSLEGMELLEQQAAALEATMGTQRAQALTEIIGRKEMTIVPQEATNLLAADAAGRILEVLLQIDNREDRAAMLPEAFTPPKDEMYENDAEEEKEEEELYTTPLQLLQAVDLWLHRAQSAPPPYLDPVDPSSSSSTLLIAGYSLGLDSDQLVRVLQDLREDILGAWEYSSIDDF
jgi:hypothetical protein